MGELAKEIVVVASCRIDLLQFIDLIEHLGSLDRLVLSDLGEKVFLSCGKRLRVEEFIDALQVLLGLVDANLLSKWTNAAMVS